MLPVFWLVTLYRPFKLTFIFPDHARGTDWRRGCSAECRRLGWETNSTAFCKVHDRSAEDSTETGWYGYGGTQSRWTGCDKGRQFCRAGTTGEYGGSGEAYTGGRRFWEATDTARAGGGDDQCAISLPGSVDEEQEGRGAGQAHRSDEGKANGAARHGNQHEAEQRVPLCIVGHGDDHAGKCSKE